MRKFVSILFVLALILGLVACKKDDADILEPVKFYYCNEEISYNSPSGVIHEELREGSGYHGDLQILLDDYLSGPVSSDLLSLIPESTELLSFQVIENVAFLELSQPFAELSGIQFSTACSCILMTLHDYADIDTVYFQVPGVQFENQNDVVFNISDIVLIDTANVKEG